MPTYAVTTSKVANGPILNSRKLLINPMNNIISNLNLPSAFRSEGSTADIKTVNIKIGTGKTSFKVRQILLK